MTAGIRFRPSCAAVAVLALPSLAWAQGSDLCAVPEPIAGLGTFAFSNVGATTDGEPAEACNAFGNSQIYNDVWFCWTADADGLVAVTTCGATFDTKLAVYANCGPCPGEGAILACNDDACGLQSKVVFSAAAGQSYAIRVGSYSQTASGSGPLAFESGYLAEVVNPDNGHLYAALESTTWTEAEALATSLGGHLVSITSEAEQNFVWSEFGNLFGIDRRIWIGLNDAGFEGVFEWSSGERVTYTNWNDGEPNDAGGNEDYAELLGSTGRWNDLPDAGGSFPHLAVIEFGKGGGGGCPADLNGSGDVDPSDLAVLLGAWGTGAGDVNGDGTTDPSDLAELLGAWGPCPG